jgi:hypothetical protein
VAGLRFDVEQVIPPLVILVIATPALLGSAGCTCRPGALLGEGGVMLALSGRRVERRSVLGRRTCSQNR